MRRGWRVAAGIVACGIDVQGISHVINYDLPRAAEDYVHRIGRTGRAGKNGIAISLANVREHFQVKLIERFTSQAIPVTTIPGLEPKARVFSKPSHPGARSPSAGKPEEFSSFGKSGSGKPAGKTLSKPAGKSSWQGK